MSSTVGKKKMGWKFDMEKEHGFKLMLHERDFVAGMTIRRNIINAIEHSRRMIVILSRLVTNNRCAKIQSTFAWL